MDYHLSLYCYLETIDSELEGGGIAAMVDAAWESALEDWESDTKGRHRLNFEAFFAYTLLDAPPTSSGLLSLIFLCGPPV